MVFVISESSKVLERRRGGGGSRTFAAISGRTV